MFARWCYERKFGISTNYDKSFKSVRFTNKSIKDIVKEKDVNSAYSPTGYRYKLKWKGSDLY